MANNNIFSMAICEQIFTFFWNLSMRSFVKVVTRPTIGGLAFNMALNSSVEWEWLVRGCAPAPGGVSNCAAGYLAAFKTSSDRTKRRTGLEQATDRSLSILHSSPLVLLFFCSFLTLLRRLLAPALT